MHACLPFSQVEKELEVLGQAKEEADKSVEAAMDSAKSFMAKSRRQPPWDGQRVHDPRKLTVEALRARVREVHGICCRVFIASSEAVVCVATPHLI